MRFLILQSDGQGGRGVRGQNLSRFLALYHGERNVQSIDSHRLPHLPPIKVDTLFIGLPTNLQPSWLSRVHFRRAVLFDYSDQAAPAWNEANRDFLLSIAGICLRPWVESHWEYDIPMGVLPIRRYANLSMYLRTRRFFRRPKFVGPRSYDVSFLGRGTGYYGDGAWEQTYNQRIEWLQELQCDGKQFKFWGGITATDAHKRQLLDRFGNVNDVFYPKKRVGFLKYFGSLQRSRIALTPTGNARWSYRHYEAIYAGALPVSTDFRRIKTLIPLPVQNMVHVADHELVVPAIERALALREARPEMAEENVRFLEQYLEHGNYSRQKPQLMDRFLAQLAN